MLSSLYNHANRIQSLSNLSLSHIARACVSKPLQRYFNELKIPAQFAHKTPAQCTHHTDFVDENVKEGESNKYTPPRSKLVARRDPSPLRLPQYSVPNTHENAQPQSRSLLTPHVSLRGLILEQRLVSGTKLSFKQPPRPDDDDCSSPVLPNHPPRLSVEASFEPQLDPSPCNPALMPAFSLKQPPRPISSQSHSSMNSDASTCDLPFEKRQTHHVDAEEFSMPVRPEQPPRLTVEASFEPHADPLTLVNGALMPALSLEQPPRPVSSKLGSSLDTESESEIFDFELNSESESEIFDLELSLEQPPRPDVDEIFEAHLPSASPRDIDLTPASSIQQPPRPEAETSIEKYLQLHLPLEPVPQPPRPSVHKSLEPRLSPPAPKEVMGNLSFPLPTPPRPLAPLRRIPFSSTKLRFSLSTCE